MRRTLWKMCHRQTEFTGESVVKRNFILNFDERFIKSQGPVQFPSNTNDYDENNLQDLPHPYERVALKTRSKLKPSARRLDYVS